MSCDQSEDQMSYMRRHPKTYSVAWHTVDIQPPIKINVLKVTSGEINAHVMKLLRVLEAKGEGKEKGRVIPPWVFQLLPLLRHGCRRLLQSSPWP